MLTWKHINGFLQIVLFQLSSLLFYFSLLQYSYVILLRHSPVQYSD